MRILKLLSFAICAAVLFTFSSCLDDDGNSSTPPVLCIDTDYYGFKADGMDNNSGLIEVVKNATSDFNTTAFTTQASFTNVGIMANNSAAYDKNAQKIAFIDQWNQGKYWEYSLSSTIANTFTIPATITAPEYLNGTLYVLEVDAAGGNLYLRTLSGTTLAPTAVPAISISSFPLADDTMNNLVFSTSNDVDKLYFVGRDHLLEIDIVTNLITQKLLPAQGRYLDVVRMQSGEFVSVLHHNGGMDLVVMDASGALIIQTVKQPNIDVNPESVSLVYKECGDRLHILTNFEFGGAGVQTRIYEKDMLQNNLITRDIPGWIFGIVHKQL